MRALAIDTSTSMAGIAVVDEHGLLAEYMLNDKKTHSQKVVPMLREILDSLKMTLADVDIFAAVTGPGSFTGLRIGVTTIKALAYAAQKPVVGITSLDALANAVNMTEGTIICPLMDARNSQVYTALYKSHNGLVSNISGYMGVHVSDLVRQIEEKNANVIFTGDGAALHSDFLKIEFGDRCLFMPDFMLQQMALPAARMALSQALQGETVSCYDLTPFYLRPSQAEREYDKKQARVGCNITSESFVRNETSV